MKLSAVVITYNEEPNIRDCLQSLRFCEEVVVVDSGSTDRTVEIARGMGARVIVKDWPGHIEQKNFAMEQASGEWILSVDADERVTPDLAQEILDVVHRPQADVQGFSVPRLSVYLGKPIRHGGWYPDRKLRLVRRGRGCWGGVNPHDQLHVPGAVRPLKADLLHFPYRDLSDHLRKIDAYTTIAAREKRLRGERSLPMLLLAAPFKFLKSYVLQLGFLDGLAGLVVAALGSWYVFLKYAKLLEIELGLGQDPLEKDLPYARTR